MHLGSAALGFVCAVALLLSPRALRAQPTQKLDAKQGSGEALGRAVKEAVTQSPPSAKSDLGYWSRGNARWFLSTRSELGTPYVKPYFSAGYGLPHWFWVGADVNAIVTPEFAQGYFGVRAASPVLDLAFGWRDTASFLKPLLEPKPSYLREDVIEARGARAHYWAWEAEAVAILPLPHAALVGDFVVVHTLDVPQGRWLYDESYRAVVASSTFGVIRGVAVARLLHEDALKAGVLGEVVLGTGRGKPVTRFGPVIALQITDHLEAVGALSLSTSSPDELGLSLGAYGVCGLRYRWATGESDPKAPWSGELIP
ncbi:MAG: hypothetical protein QM756_06625 [Polyangiaceae bacterium]